MQIINHSLKILLFY